MVSQFVVAYLLAVLGGNISPTAEDLKDILTSVGADSDEDNKIEKLLNSVKGKDITELIAAGREKLASVPSGGGGGGIAIAAAAPAATGAAPAATGAAPAAEAKKEEKAVEKEEFDDDPNNKNMINCDEKLKSILLGKGQVDLVELPALIKLHFPKESKFHMM